MTENEILLHINFKDKAFLGRDDEPDYLIFKFWAAQKIKTREGNTMFFKEPFMKKIQIPTQIDSDSKFNKATKTAATAVMIIGKTALVTAVALRFVFNFAMAELLGMFAIVQLLIYFPLLNVSFPGMALILWEKVIEVVSFDLLQTDDWYPDYFGFDETHYIGCLEGDEADKNCLQHFNNFDFGNT